MSYSFAPRLTIPYDDVSGVFDIWSQYCAQMIVYQHPIDATVKSIHCHVLMLGCKIQEEAFKRKFKPLYPKIDTKGNTFWKWTTKHGIPDASFITYMTKGKFEPSYNMGFDSVDVAHYKSLWRDPTSEASVIAEGKYDEYEQMKKEIDIESVKMNGVIDLREVRSKTMHWY